MADNELLIKISGDPSDYKDALRESSLATENFGEVGKRVLEALTFAALIEGAHESIAAFVEQERAAVDLTLTLQNQGIYTKELADQYKEIANAISAKTGIDEDQIIRAQAAGQSLLGQKVITEQLTQAVVDFAAKQKLGLVEAFTLVARAANNSTTVLQRHGLTVQDASTSTERLQNITEALETKFGGTAQAMADVSGSTAHLTKDFEDMTKQVGEQLTPAFDGLVKSAQSLIPSGETIKAIGVDFRTAGALAKDFYSLLFEGENNGEDALTGIKNTIATISRMFGEFHNQVVAASNEKFGPEFVDEKALAAKKAAADKLAAEEAAANSLRLQKDAAQNELIALQDSNATKDSIELKKQEIQILTELENKHTGDIAAALRNRLAVVRQAQQNAFDSNFEAEKVSLQKSLETNQFYQQLDEAGKEDFLRKNASALKTAQLTETTAMQKNALDEQNLQIKNHNQRLLDQQKFGVAYAAINEAMHSAIYEGSKSAFGDLAALEQSSNSTLKEIGRVAAIANIVIKTAESAMNIYAGFSTIPIIGPALGVAGAAAAVAFGAEQVQAVTAAADGGLITGGIPNLDSVPAMLMPGELVVPTKNFDEVVGAVQDSRSGDTGGGGGDIYITVQGDVLAEQSYIQKFAQAFSDALERGNLKVYGISSGRSLLPA